MPIGTIAPWLHGPDVLGAMEAGAGAGVRAHEIDVNASLRRAELAQRGAEAAAQLGLESTRLNFEHQAQQERQKAADTMREATIGFREQGLQLGQERLAQTGENQKAANDLREANLKLQQDKFANQNKSNLSPDDQRYLNSLISRKAAAIGDDARVNAIQSEIDKLTGKTAGAVPLSQTEDATSALYTPATGTLGGETLPLATPPKTPSIYMGPNPGNAAADLTGGGIQDIQPQTMTGTESTPSNEDLSGENLPEPATTAVKEVVRMTKDGKKAIFDANTKQFLRYGQ